MTRPLPDLLLVAVVGCGTTEQVGDAHGDDAPDATDTTVEPDTHEDPVDSADPVEEDPAEEPLCLEIATSIRLSDIPGEIARVAWSGSEFGVLWWELPNAIRFSRVSDTGVEVYSDLLYSAFIERPPMDLIWTGSEYAAVISDRIFGPVVYNSLGLVRIDPDGTLGEGYSITGPPGMDSDGGRVAWSGSTYGLAWFVDTGVRHDVYFQVFSPGFTYHADPLVVSGLSYEPSHDLWGPDVVWNGSDWDVAWFGCSPCGDPYVTEIMHALVNADGLDSSETIRFPFPPEYLISSGMNIDTSWTGSRLGLAWNHRLDDYRIYISALEETGTSMSPDPVALGRVNHSHEEPSITWTGSQFAVAYSEEDVIRLRTFHPADMSEDRSVWISTDTHQANVPDLVWTGSEFGLVWQESWGEWYIYFGRVRFCP